MTIMTTTIFLCVISIFILIIIIGLLHIYIIQLINNMYPNDMSRKFNERLIIIDKLSKTMLVLCTIIILIIQVIIIIL